MTSMSAENTSNASWRWVTVVDTSSTRWLAAFRIIVTLSLSSILQLVATLLCCAFPYISHFRRLARTELKRPEKRWTEHENAKMMLFCALLVILWKDSYFGYPGPRFFKTSRKAKMKMFPPTPSIIAPTWYTYNSSKLLTSLILQTCCGPCILWKVKPMARFTILQ